MATPEQMKSWLDSNKDKAGTQDFVRVTDAYNKAVDATPTGEPLLSPTSVAQSLRRSVSAFPTAASDPGGPLATAGRIATGAVTGIPDIAIGIGNAGVRAGGSGGGFGMYGVEPGSVKEAPYIGPMVNRAAGVPELPADASTTRQLLEGGGSALLGGGANAIRSAVSAAPTVAQSIWPAITALARTTAGPTIASHYGGHAGQAIAEKFGLDPQTGQLLGSLFGATAASKAAEVPQRYTDWRYRGQGADNAAETFAQAGRQDVPLTAGMVGNQSIQLRERGLANQPGAMNFINSRRQDARDAIGAALDRAAAARGSTDPAPTPGTIGYNVAEVGRTGARDLGNISSAGQESLMNQPGGVGPRAPTDISGVLAAMERIRNQTDPGTAAPIDARIGTMRQMLPRDPQGNILSTDVPYERVKDWRTALRERSQNYDPVPGRFAGQIYDATTGAMRDAAVNQGVPGQRFDNTQQRTAGIMGEGGPHEQLTAVGGAEPSAAYSYLRGGEQNPQRLRMLQATGNPAIDRVFGDYLRLLGNNTINAQGARGPANLANAIERMHPEALDVIGGGTPVPGGGGRIQADNVRDVGGLSRAYDYPTSQTGLGRTMGPISHGVPGTLTAGEVGHAAGAATGIPGAGPVGRVLGYSLGPVRRAIEARMLQSPTAINAMAGGPRPAGSPTSISDLVAAINAANSQQPRGPVR